MRIYVEILYYIFGKIWPPWHARNNECIAPVSIRVFINLFRNSLQYEILYWFLLRIWYKISLATYSSWRVFEPLVSSSVSVFRNFKKMYCKTMDLNISYLFGMIYVIMITYDHDMTCFTKSVFKFIEYVPSLFIYSIYINSLFPLLLSECKISTLFQSKSWTSYSFLWSDKTLWQLHFLPKFFLCSPALVFMRQANSFVNHIFNNSDFILKMMTLY